MKNAETLLAECKELKFPSLKWNKEAKTYDDVEVSCDCFVKNGVVMVTSDDGLGAIDYYGEYRGGYPYINPKLEAFAKANGCFWEWNNPSSVSLHEA